MDDLFIRFTTADKKGQYTDGFRLQVKMVKWHGLTDEGMLWDIVHSDGTHERLLIRCEKYGDFRIGNESEERVVGIAMTTFEYPVLTKDEYHKRVGKGRFLCPRRKHFVRESEMLPPLTDH